MPSSNCPAIDLVNSDLQRENQYNDVDLVKIIAIVELLLTAEQRNIYYRIMLTVDFQQGIFFLRRSRWNR